MSTALALSTLVLAALFAVAGIGKVLDPTGSRAGLRSFGVPARLSGAVWLGLAVAELALAVTLLVPGTRWWGGIGALGLLVTFSAAIVSALARGRRPDCHCFGQLHSEPVGWRTLARNGILIALALAVVAVSRDDPRPPAFGWAGRLGAGAWAIVALGVALAVATCVGAYALRSYGRVLLRLERVEGRLREAGLELDDPQPELGLAPGTRAPAFWLPSTTGARVALDELLDPGLPVLLLFTSPTCGPCSVLLPEVARWQRDHAEELTVAVLTDGDPHLIGAEAAAHGLENVLLDTKLELYEAYGANGTPSAVLVGDDGRVASRLAAGPEWIGSLVEDALTGFGSAPGLPIGSDPPGPPLATLDGWRRTICELVEGPTVVLFWNPSCGFCGSMRDDVLAWEAGRPSAAPSLLVVSAGTLEEVRAEGFGGPVLLDPDWSLATAFGADGTPMAVLLDADGRVASSLSRGADAVFALLGSTEPAAVA